MEETAGRRWAGGAPLGRGKRLGDILVEANVITRDQLEAALSQQQPSGPLLGRVLMDMGLVTEADVARALAHQLGLPYLDGADLEVDPAAARRISPATARKYGAVPVREEGGALVVAMTDPANVLAIDDIAFRTGREVRPAVVTAATLDKALRQAYAGWTEEGADAPAEARRGPPEPAAWAPAPMTASARPAGPLPTGEDAPIIRLVNNILDRAIAERASDVHIEPMAGRVRVRYRIDGVLHDAMLISPADHPACVSRIKIMASMDISEKRVPQDGRIQLRDDRRDVDLRVSTLPTIFGEKVAIRILDKNQAITDLDRLGLSAGAMAAYLRMAQQAYGMILVTGPTGSGKTTTLMATLHRLNSPEKNIITIEDPVEYQVDGVNQVHVNPRAGLTFAAGLRSILRQDPNIIMVGEVRDRETADIAIRSALTGHLVLSTMHTNN
ncbi:MAG: GspE/PulE family protein, partial [Acetobacteraceae bacterium]|nr:GspE/PulE family protein [Acetobacteraceae bacterium]